MLSLINDYKNVGELIIKELEQESFENLENLIAKRDEINQKLLDMDIDREKFLMYVEELKIRELDMLIITKMQDKKSIIKSEIEKLQQRKKANLTYNNAQNKIQFLNVKL